MQQATWIMTLRSRTASLKLARFRDQFHFRFQTSLHSFSASVIDFAHKNGGESGICPAYQIEVKEKLKIIIIS